MMAYLDQPGPHAFSIMESSLSWSQVGTARMNGAGTKSRTLQLGPRKDEDLRNSRAKPVH